MRLRNYVPEDLIAYIKILRIRHRYPQCNIGSHLIADNVVLGIDCTIARDVELSPNVTIGDYSYVNAGTVVTSGSIGKFCSIGYFCQIGLPKHPTNFLSTSPRIYGWQNILGIPSTWEDYPSPPIIENDVWIGSNALIMQNVRVQNGAIVASGAVVTKDVEPYTIVQGIPAKPTRKRFDENTINDLLEWKWWELTVEELQHLSDFFPRSVTKTNIDRFLT
jgi:virginiamycin A acetyltransferase